MIRDTAIASAQRQRDSRNPLACGRTAAFLLFAVGAAFGTPAAAQQSNADRPDLLADLQSCRAIDDSARRLACFDRAAASLLAARDSGDVRVVDREEVQETRRSLFGFTLPKLIASATASRSTDRRTDRSEALARKDGAPADRSESARYDFVG